MNFVNADTLTPIMKMRRSEAERAWGGLVRLPTLAQEIKTVQQKERPDPTIFGMWEQRG